jgi:hypothetical protein
MSIICDHAAQVNCSPGLHTPPRLLVSFDMPSSRGRKHHVPEQMELPSHCTRLLTIQHGDLSQDRRSGGRVAPKSSPVAVARWATPQREGLARGCHSIQQCQKTGSMMEPRTQSPPLRSGQARIYVMRYIDLGAVARIDRLGEGALDLLQLLFLEMQHKKTCRVRPRQVISRTCIRAVGRGSYRRPISACSAISFSTWSMVLRNAHYQGRGLHVCLDSWPQEWNIAVWSGHCLGGPECQRSRSDLSRYPDMDASGV